MEFDTGIKLKPLRQTVITSEKDFGSMVKGIWDILAKRVHDIGQSAEGELWMDYSTTMSTRHLVCNIDELSSKDPMMHNYRVTFRSGARPGMVADVAAVFLVLAAFWCLSKILVPGAGALYITGMTIAAGLAAALMITSGKTFGANEADEIIYEIENTR